MKAEVTTFTDYNIKKKLIPILIFIGLSVFPILGLAYQYNKSTILIVTLWELIIMPFTILYIINHISLYPDRIEYGIYPFKFIVLFKDIKELDMIAYDETIKGKTTKVLAIVFFSNSGVNLMHLELRHTARLSEIIYVIENNTNNRVTLSKSLTEYLNKNTNYKEK